MYRNQDSVRMAPPVNKPGHPPDVIALIATKETNVTVVLNVFKETVARNVPLVSKVTNVNSALRDSKEMVAGIAPFVFKGMNVKNVLKGSRETTVIPARLVIMVIDVVSKF